MIFAAHNAERKGFPLLAQAFNKLDDQFHLHIVGKINLLLMGFQLLLQLMQWRQAVF